MKQKNININDIRAHDVLNGLSYVFLKSKTKFIYLSLLEVYAP